MFITSMQTFFFFFLQTHHLSLQSNPKSWWMDGPPVLPHLCPCPSPQQTPCLSQISTDPSRIPWDRKTLPSLLHYLTKVKPMTASLARALVCWTVFDSPHSLKRVLLVSMERPNPGRALLQRSLPSSSMNQYCSPPKKLFRRVKVVINSNSLLDSAISLLTQH